jgi:hypothetical protein
LSERGVVIGPGLAPALYALINDHVLIQNMIEPPHRFDFLDPGDPSESLGIVNEVASLVGEDGLRTVGVQKSALWRRVLFVLSMRGSLPFADKVDSIRLHTENKLSVTTTGNKKYDIDFDRLRIFDSRHIEGLEFCDSPPQRSDKKLILDWFNVRSGCVHRFDLLHQSGNFVREVHFYPSDRIAGNHDKKDLVSFSYLTEEECRSPDYSSVLAKYKILNWMRGAGIRGQSNGRDPNDPTKKKHYAIRIEHARRQVIDMPCDAGEIKEMLQILSEGFYGTEAYK